MSIETISLSGRKKQVSKRDDRKECILLRLWLIYHRQAFKKSTSISRVREMSPVYRGQHQLKRDEQGRETVRLVDLCCMSCGSDYNERENAKQTRNIYTEKKNMLIYEINMLRCIFCGL
jgi:NADH-quinone oxidoreductase subunit I